MCRCATCQHFIPDKIGSGQGIGNCQKYDDFKEQGADEHQLKIAFRKLGNEVFWGGLYGLPRNCSKYEEKENEIKQCQSQPQALEKGGVTGGSKKPCQVSNFTKALEKRNSNKPNAT